LEEGIDEKWLLDNVVIQDYISIHVKRPTQISSQAELFNIAEIKDNCLKCLFEQINQNLHLTTSRTM